MTVLTSYKRTILPARNVIATWKIPPSTIFYNLLTPESQTKRPSTTAATNGSLPPLSVPSLTSTLEKFLSFAKPLQSAQDYELTVQVAKKFLANEQSAHLQSLLQQRAQKLQNWLTPWWLHVAYLNARAPLPIVTSPGVTFPHFNFKGIYGQVHYAAKIINAALQFHHKIIQNELEPEYGAGGVLLDMCQYKRIFGTTRIPQRNCDAIRYGKDQPQWAQHILVTRNGHTFYVNVYDYQDNILGLDQLKRQLMSIVKNSSNPRKYCVNIVSSDDREAWADVYARLKENNPDEVRIYENALFVMCLDRNFSDCENAEERNMQMALHGGDAKFNARNRWFDKTLQFYLNANGYGGMTYEHTPAEGPPLAKLLDFICDKIEEDSFVKRSCGNMAHKYPRLLRLEFDKSEREAIMKAEDKHRSVIQNLEIKMLAFGHFGKDVPKQAGLSPDSWIQLALQLAYYRMHRTHAPAYETGTLRRFHEGRTDTIRMPTMQSVQFVEAISSSVPRTLSDNELFTLLEAAIARHKQYSLEVINGMGIDRHLLGLKLIAAENQLPVPEILQTDAYKKLMHFRLSTSQVPTRNNLQMAFGPSEPDCYGICYNPQEHRILFSITAFNECEETSAERFSMELQRALLDMRDVVDRAGKLKERAKL